MGDRSESSGSDDAMTRNKRNDSAGRREDWETPRWLFDYLDKTVGFNFAIDLAASSENALCVEFIDNEINVLTCERKDFLDGGPFNDLAHRWAWCNPPYGKSGLTAWSKLLTKTVPSVVALIPASVGAQWFHHFFSTATVVVFINKRLKFGNAPQGAQFDSALYIRGDLITVKQIEQLRVLGCVVVDAGIKPWAGSAAFDRVRRSPITNEDSCGNKQSVEE